METLLLTMVLFLVIVAVMAVGVMLSGRSLRGSCGGSSCVCKAEDKDPGSCKYQGPVLPTR